MTWMWLWWIPAAVVLGLLGYAAARLLQPRRKPPVVATTSGTGPASGTAERLLDERYARGEVDRNQYLDTRDRLRDS